MMCEKCWRDAALAAHLRGGSQTDHYQTLLLQRVNTPCTPEEQAGEYWDEEKQIDRRKIEVSHD